MRIYFNKDKIKQKEMALIRYNGFIPLQFHGYIDVKQRNDYLKVNGLFDNVQKEKNKFRIDMKNSGDADVYLDNFLLDWLEKNPQFKDLIIIE